MAKIFNHVLSTLLFAFIVLNLPRESISDEPCPYPCYPPPTGTGTPTTPATPTTTTTTPPSQTGTYPPPPGSSTGYNPYNPPPDTSFGATPPPPDPVLPYFPFYYKEPLHSTNVSSATSLARSTLIVLVTDLVLLFLVTLFSILM